MSRQPYRSVIPDGQYSPYVPPRTPWRTRLSRFGLYTLAGLAALTVYITLGGFWLLAGLLVLAGVVGAVQRWRRRA